MFEQRLLIKLKICNNNSISRIKQLLRKNLDLKKTCTQLQTMSLRKPIRA